MTDKERQEGEALFGDREFGGVYTPAQKEWLRRVFPTSLNSELAEIMRLTPDGMRSLTFRMGLRKRETYSPPQGLEAALRKGRELFRGRKRWSHYTERQLDWLRSVYPLAPDEEVARAAGMNTSALHGVAGYHGIRKDTLRTASLMGERSHGWYKRQKRRSRLGLPKDTGRYIDETPLAKGQYQARHYGKCLGYIPGDTGDPWDRYAIYYTQGTRRSARFEKGLERRGMYLYERKD